MVYLGGRMSLFLGVAFWKYLGLLSHESAIYFQKILQKKSV